MDTNQNRCICLPVFSTGCYKMPGVPKKEGQNKLLYHGIYIHIYLYLLIYTYIQIYSYIYIYTCKSCTVYESLPTKIGCQKLIVLLWHVLPIDQMCSHTTAPHPAPRSRSSQADAIQVDRKKGNEVVCRCSTLTKIWMQVCLACIVIIIIIIIIIIICFRSFFEDMPQQTLLLCTFHSCHRARPDISLIAPTRQETLPWYLWLVSILLPTVVQPMGESVCKYMLAIAHIYMPMTKEKDFACLALHHCTPFTACISWWH